MSRFVKFLLIICFSVFLYSCEKKCFQERNTLESINLENIRPSGTYVIDEFLGKDKIVFHTDSTATITYTENDTTYEFSYKIKSLNSYESYQEKY